LFYDLIGATKILAECKECVLNQPDGFSVCYTASDIRAGLKVWEQDNSHVCTYYSLLQGKVVDTTGQEGDSSNHYARYPRRRGQTSDSRQEVEGQIHKSKWCMDYCILVIKLSIEGVHGIAVGGQHAHYAPVVL